MLAVSDVDGKTHVDPKYLQFATSNNWINKDATSISSEELHKQIRPRTHVQWLWKEGLEFWKRREKDIENHKIRGMRNCPNFV